MRNKNRVFSYAIAILLSTLFIASPSLAGEFKRFGFGKRIAIWAGFRSPAHLNPLYPSAVLQETIAMMAREQRNTHDRTRGRFRSNSDDEENIEIKALTGRAYDTVIEVPFEAQKEDAELDDFYQSVSSRPHFDILALKLSTNARHSIGVETFTAQEAAQFSKDVKECAMTFRAVAKMITNADDPSIAQDVYRLARKNYKRGLEDAREEKLRNWKRALWLQIPGAAVGSGGAIGAGVVCAAEVYRQIKETLKKAQNLNTNWVQ